MTASHEAPRSGSVHRLALAGSQIMTDDIDLTQTLDLVRQAQGGDDDALNRLFQRYSDRVRTIIRLRLGERLRRRLESVDILQDTFVEAVKSFDRFEMRDEGSLIHWLSRLAERRILAANEFHGAQKRSIDRVVPLEIGDPVVSPAWHGPSPFESAVDAENTSRVETCIGELPEEYREVIILRDYAGASWRTIADELGRKSEDGVRMLHARALVALGKLARRAGLE